jgi:hypothetical protein
MGKTTDLRRELKRSFIPHVVGRGFVVDHTGAPFFLTFRRIVNGELHVFDIQWEKYGARRFVINFGKASADGGATFAGERLVPERTDPVHCPENGRLQPGRGPGPSSWFRQDRSLVRWLVAGRRLYDAQEVVAQLLTTFGELEAYWERGTIGPHMRM